MQIFIGKPLQMRSTLHVRLIGSHVYGIIRTTTTHGREISLQD